MSCLNELQIQLYIDGELSMAEQSHINGHLNDCAVCKKLVFEQRKHINEAFMQLDELFPIQEITIPEFKLPIQEKRKTLRLAPWIWAAAGIVMLLTVGVAFQKHEQQQRIENQFYQAQWEASQQINLNQQWQSSEPLMVYSGKNNPFED